MSELSSRAVGFVDNWDDIQTPVLQSTMLELVDEIGRLENLIVNMAQHLEDDDFARMSKKTVLAIGTIWDESDFSE